jgi:hypothetical protein
LCVVHENYCTFQGPFLRGGVPTGSIDTGASSSKPVAERDVFGGMPYAAYDECYHRLCMPWLCQSDDLGLPGGRCLSAAHGHAGDDIYNIHVPPLVDNTVALAGALGVLLPLEDLPGWLDGDSPTRAV